jgi:hypothetical protein
MPPRRFRPRGSGQSEPAERLPGVVPTCSPEEVYRLSKAALGEPASDLLWPGYDGEPLIDTETSSDEAGQQSHGEDDQTQEGAESPEAIESRDDEGHG